MALAPRRATYPPSQNDDEVLFGLLVMNNCRYLEAVIQPPEVPTSVVGQVLLCGKAPSFDYLQLTSGSLALENTALAVVYQPHYVGASALDELSHHEVRTASTIADMRRKVSGFSQLAANWDGEGAAQVSAETIRVALLVVEHIAIVLDRKSADSTPSVRAFPDGSIFIKWIRGQKELAITISGSTVEVQHWHPLDAFESEGLWEISVDAISEHVEWVLT